ncbi:hypothetical protein GCM10009069_09910 [Algimonas arctica]|uniref:Uncharacterized protein n=1 Tax=Algimonas arctica TaxID=1479486 RepID=A0A8J3CQ43_9PROT|nr:hypothetical protein GCM10009069_09910 [Algimonas arctica]
MVILAGGGVGGTGAGGTTAIGAELVDPPPQALNAIMADPRAKVCGQCLNVIKNFHAKAVSQA